MLKTGTRIGGLLIGDMLGRGAMGEVYRGVQLSLRRPVAVKRIAGHLLDDPDIVARFAREAQCVAKVASQHVVGVYEFGTFPDQDGEEHVLLVMELVDGGESLKNAIIGALDWHLAASVVMQVSEGLMAAGEHGVVHRDIKPDNIMLSRKGVAKLCDFGLARSVDSTAMTMEGSLLGTPNYMPPEACRGDAVEHPGDIYSLGATWYHMLVGRPPFRAGNTMALLRAHIEDEPAALRDELPDLPEQIESLVMRCMSKQAELRPTAEQLHNELNALAGEGFMLPRTVPELLPGAPPTHGADEGSSMATLIAQDETLAPAIAGKVDATAATLPMGSTDDDATVATLPMGEQAMQPSKRSPVVPIVVGLLAVVGITAGVLWSLGIIPPASTPQQAGGSGEAPVIVDRHGATDDADEPPSGASDDPPSLTAAGGDEGDPDPTPADHGGGSQVADDMPVVADDPPVVDEPPVVADDPPVVDDTPVVADDPPVVDETPVVADEPPAVDEPPVVADDPPAVAEPPVVADDPPVVDEPPLVADDPPVVDETPVVADDPPVVDEPPVVADEPPVDAEPPAVTDDQPAVEDEQEVAATTPAQVAALLEERRFRAAGEQLEQLPEGPERAALAERQADLVGERNACLQAILEARRADDLATVEQQVTVLATFPEDAELTERLVAVVNETEREQLAAIATAEQHFQADELLPAVQALQQLPAEDKGYTAASLERRNAVEGPVVTAINERVASGLLAFEAALTRRAYPAAKQALVEIVDLAPTVGRQAEVDAAVRRLTAAVGQ